MTGIEKKQLLKQKCIEKKGDIYHDREINQRANGNEISKSMVGYKEC